MGIFKKEDSIFITFKEKKLKKLTHLLPRQAFAMLRNCWNACNSRCFLHNFSLKLGRLRFLFPISNEFGLKLWIHRCLRFKILIANNVQWYWTPGNAYCFAYPLVSHALCYTLDCCSLKIVSLFSVQLQSCSLNFSKTCPLQKVRSLRHWNTELVSSGVSLTSWREVPSLFLVGYWTSDCVTKILGWLLD